jgi:hypothetical protein
MKTQPRKRSQPDGSSEPLNKVERPIPGETTPDGGLDPGDEHIGATEDQVSDTSPPAGDAFDDEPKQG